MREERPRDREREREEGSVLKTGKGEFLFASGPPGDSRITPRGYFLSFFFFVLELGASGTRLRCGASLSRA